MDSTQDERTAAGSGPQGGPRVRVLTSGSETANILVLALPAMSSLFLQSAFNLIDTFWVGRLGPSSLAAVSVSAFLIWAMFSLAEALSLGVNSLVARHIGAGEAPAADRAAYQGILWSVAGGILTAAVGLPLLPSLFSLMHTTDAVASQGWGYAGTLFVAAPLVFAFFVMEAIFRGRGDTVTPLKILGFALLLNAVLDPVLILGWGPAPALGVRGAAIATVVSRLAGLAVGLAMLAPTLRRGAAEGRGPDPALALRTVRIGAPTAAAGFFFCAVYVILARIVGRFGTEPLAALGVGHRVETLTYLTCVGFGTAATTLVGQNLGAGQPERADRLVRRSLYMLTALQLAYMAVLLLFAPGIMSAFTGDAAVIAHGTSYLRIVAISQVFMGMSVLYISSFGGAGSTMPAMLLDLPLTALRIPLAWFLGVRLGWGAEGVWWAISLSTVAAGLSLWGWWSRGGWRRYRP